MSDFAGMEDLLQDFLQEAGELLSDVDNKLVDLEKMPDDFGLLNDIFRGFHTIKGGAGFLSASELVSLCHVTENLFDRLRTGDMRLGPELMDLIMSATQGVRDMFGDLTMNAQPHPAPAALMTALHQTLESGMPPGLTAAVAVAPAPAVVPASIEPPPTPAPSVAPAVASPGNEPNWPQLQEALSGAAGSTASSTASSAVSSTVVNSTAIDSTKAVAAAPALIVAEPLAVSALPVVAEAPTLPTAPPVYGRSAAESSGAAAPTRRTDSGAARENTIRIDTARLDQVLNLSGEIGLTKNRLNSLRSDILAGKTDADTLHALDQAVGQLDLLVSDLQNSVMKSRMQPIGRLFQKYPRIARDLARQLGKDVELVLAGEETEVDKTMIEDLADPLIHLIRNAVDHGVEVVDERIAAGKPAKSMVRLEARQEGDHILLIVADDGRGMSAERIRAKAVEKGLINEEEANTLDERQSLNLIFLPGFSTKSQISDVSGRGVGMDVVKTNIQRMNGSVEIRSEPGKGSAFFISLPLTMAILPVLLVLLDDQPFALPLSMVREILPIDRDKLSEVGGRETLVVRGEILPLLPLARLLGWPQEGEPAYGVLMQTAEKSFILAVDNFAGRDDAVIKSLDDFRPRGVAGVTTLSNGQIVLILDMKELLTDLLPHGTA